MSFRLIVFSDLGTCHAQFSRERKRSVERGERNLKLLLSSMFLLAFKFDKPITGFSFTPLQSDHVVEKFWKTEEPQLALERRDQSVNSFIVREL